MDQFEFRPQEISEAREATESTETQALEDATFEPAAFVEQAGDYKQSEAIQSGLEVVMANITTGRTTDSTPIALPRQTDLASGTGGVKGSGGEKVGITPINLPRQANLASEAGGVKGSGGEQIGITPINLPREADLASETEQPGNAVASGEVKGPGGGGVASGEVKGPGGGGVADGMLEGPGGDPEAVIGFKFYTPDSAGSVEIPLHGIVRETTTRENDVEDLEEQLNSIGDDAQFADIDLQEVLEKQQQIIEILSRTSQNLSDMTMSVIRNMK
jgi:hypothetical protein